MKKTICILFFVAFCGATKKDKVLEIEIRKMDFQTMMPIPIYCDKLELEGDFFYRYFFYKRQKKNSDCSFGT